VRQAESIRWGLAAAVIAAVVFTSSAVAQEVKTAAVGPQYAAGGAQRFWFGDGYRDLWTAPVELPVLDLKTTGGGLAPVRVVGQAQSLGLALRGADGKAYTFRSLHKHPERMLPEAWRDRWPAKLAQDQTSGTHPGAALVQAALAKAAGVPFTNPRLVIMPDDPALGEFRKQFANEIGTFDEFPLAGPNKTPGFMGATEIVSSEDMWVRQMQGPENRVDSRALLRARVLDLWTDNYDRHRGQWRWMHVPGTPLWQPLPEDPDFVLVRHDGVVGAVIRGRVPDFLAFSGKFPGKLEGALNNAYQVDRWLLTDLDAAAWRQVVKDVVGRLSDDVIDAALRALPPTWFELSGRKTAGDLKKRRAGLEQYVMDVYRLESRTVNVHATDRDELVSIARGTDNSVELTIAVAGGAEPYFRRRFLAAETKELRVHLHGGSDRVERTGEPGGPVTIRVIAGGGNDVIDDSKSGGTDVWRDAGTVEVQRGSGTRVRGGVWVNPEPVKGAPWIEPRSFGHFSTASPIVGFSPDAGFLLGYGVTRTGWGFRTTNVAASEQTIRAGFATSDVNGRVDYSGTFRRPASNLAFRFETFGSGIERANFFGLGNDTPNETDKARYRTQQNVFYAAPALVVEQGRQFELFVAPEARYSRSDAATDSILSGSGAIGTGDYGQFAVRGGLRYDSRERGEIHAAADLAAGAGQLGGEGRHVSGVSLQAAAFVVPKAWDVDSQYSGVDGTLAAYLGNTRAHLALRVGGRKLYGDYAWFDAAYIGSRNNRGFLSHRFTGDSSLFGTVALRAWIREVPASVPVRFGVIAFADTGRVWYAGEDSNTWHNSFGGGLMFQPLATPTTVYAALAHSKEGNRFYFGIGFPF
jgi:hypothetical protein